MLFGFASHVDNDVRAEWARNALEVFCQEVFNGRDFAELLEAKEDGATNNASDGADAIGDLITDLLHLARKHGIDPTAIARIAVANFEEEEEEEAREDDEDDGEQPF